MINVTVDTIPETVTCNARAQPEPTYRWFREGSRSDTIIYGRVLDLKIAVPRRSNGTYYCEASNRHGSRNISMTMNVQCKWRNILTRRELPSHLEWRSNIEKDFYSQTFGLECFYLSLPFRQIFLHFVFSPYFFVILFRIFSRKRSHFLFIYASLLILIGTVSFYAIVPKTTWNLILIFRQNTQW